MKRRHEYVTLEHILFCILRNRSGAEIIESCGGRIENLNNALEAFFIEQVETVPEGSEYRIQHTPSLDRASVARAARHALRAGKQEVTVGDVLATIEERDS